jgi:carbamoyl-phosphate synthase large subunit
MTVSQRSVLVVPAGTAIGLEIGESLANSKHWKVYAANSVRDHSEVVFHRPRYDLPYADDPQFAAAVAKVAKEVAADFVIPAHDDAIFALAGPELGQAKFVGPSRPLADVLRFKSRTYSTLAAEVAIPTIYDPRQLNPSDFPLFVKPDRGQGSRGAQLLRSEEDLSRVSLPVEEYIFVEHLPGAEYTVDCYTTRDGQLAYCSPRVRTRTSGGISVRTEEVSDARFLEMAKRISAALEIGGAWFFQMKEDRDGRLKLLEVANRVSGAMGFQRERGINLIEAWLHELSGHDVEFLPWDFGPLTFDRALTPRILWEYRPACAYVDLDDTIILPSGKLNYRLIGLLYGLKFNVGVRLVLLTRHKTLPATTLERLALGQLFDDTCHLENGESKADFITTGQKAIFIDDSFAERAAVWRRHKIPTFPIEAMACLEGLNHAALG